MLAGYKIRRHNLYQLANALFYFASPVYEYRYLSILIVCLPPNLGKIFVQDENLEEHTPDGEVG